MKLKAEPIIELINQVSYWIDGIKETCRMGGDIIGSIDGQVDEIKKLLIQFKASHIVQPEADPVPDYKRHYLGTAEKILSQNKAQSELTRQESMCLIQAKLYSWIKRTIRERKDMPGPESSDHDIMCYVDNIMAEWEHYRAYEKDFYYTLNQVVLDITEEIVEQRKLNQQQKLF
jgi:hypothetical protein